MRVELFGTSDRVRMAEAIALRFAVFVDEQRVPAEEELDEHDDAADSRAVHALVRDLDDTVLGTGRYFVADAQTAQVGRMAVRDVARGRGVGRMLLDALLHDAQARGLRRATLNAQEHAVGFYTRAGFAARGATTVECAIVHQPMTRQLR